MARRLHLVELAVVAPCPVDVPRGELANALRASFAQQGRELLVAQTAPGRERVRKMKLGPIRLDLAQRRRAGHLRHDGRATTADHVLVDHQNARTVPRRGDGGKHACPAAADHQDVAFEGERIKRHAGPWTAPPGCAAG
jgi:hypothetical protein